MLTVFSTCRAFEGCYEFIQTNAVTSWTRLDPRPEVILFGDEDGGAEVARRLDCAHASRIDRHACGLPYVGALFGAARALASHDLMAYVNADLILFQDFMDAVRTVSERFGRFLMIGSRQDWLRREPINFIPGWQDWVRAAIQGHTRPRKALDYFVFTKDVYDIDFPPLVLARYWWDPWLVWSALSRGIPVVDASPSVLALHQQHGAAVLARNDPVARRNRELAGEEAIRVGIDDATWAIGNEGLKKK
jgi:hypothetical protein